jgi:hypothetical protein
VTTPNADAAITSGTVAVMARLAGLDIPSDRLPAIAVRLRELFELAAEIDGLDLDGIEPAMGFDPRWPEEAMA